MSRFRETAYWDTLYKNLQQNMKHILCDSWFPILINLSHRNVIIKCNDYVQFKRSNFFIFLRKLSLNYMHIKQHTKLHRSTMMVWLLQIRNAAYVHIPAPFDNNSFY